MGHRRGGRSARRVLPGIQAQAIRRAEHAGKTCGLSVTIDRAGGRACLAEGAARIAIRSGNRSALMHQERSGGSYCQTESESEQYGELGKGQEFGFGLIIPAPLSVYLGCVQRLDTLV